MSRAGGLGLEKHSPPGVRDTEREQAVKDALDAVAYHVRFFRDFDEPNDIFACRLIAHLGERLALRDSEEGV